MRSRSRPTRKWALSTPHRDAGASSSCCRRARGSPGGSRPGNFAQHPPRGLVCRAARALIVGANEPGPRRPALLAVRREASVRPVTPEGDGLGLGRLARRGPRRGRRCGAARLCSIRSTGGRPARDPRRRARRRPGPLLAGRAVALRARPRRGRARRDPPRRLATGDRELWKEIAARRTRSGSSACRASSSRPTASRTSTRSCACSTSCTWSTGCVRRRAVGEIFGVATALPRIRGRPGRSALSRMLNSSLQCRTGADSRTNAASSVSATRMTPPISRTSVCTPSSTGARSRPGSPRSTRARSTSRGRWATSPTSSTRPGSRVCRAGRPSATSGTRRPAPRCSLNAQPIVFATGRGPLALAHNGNLVNAREIRASLESKGALFTTTSDSEMILHLVARSQAPTLAAAIAEALSEVRGAYSLVILSREGIFAVRDPHGIRPLSLGIREGSPVVASETCAFDLIGAKFERDVEPGEIVRLSREGFSSHRFAFPVSTPCVFEHVYFARPDSKVFGRSVATSRQGFGRRLAREHPGAGGRRRGGSGLRHVPGARLRRGVGDPVRPRPRPQPLRRPDLHRAEAVDPPLRRQGQAQPGARGRGGQARRARRRFHRPGDDVPQDRPHAARGGRAKRSTSESPPRRPSRAATTASTRRRATS